MKLHLSSILLLIISQLLLPAGSLAQHDYFEVVGLNNGPHSLIVAPRIEYYESRFPSVVLDDITEDGYVAKPDTVKKPDTLIPDDPLSLARSRIVGYDRHHRPLAEFYAQLIVEQYADSAANVRVFNAAGTDMNLNQPLQPLHKGLTIWYIQPTALPIDVYTYRIETPDGRLLKTGPMQVKYTD